ncbi:MAG: type II secretion system minor pseudopilin GspI [Gammaproteobacteria bacterium]|nr:type II secretion system minor pseudopilin GspI [Gammaproteobacteria bacterium]
MMMKAERRQRGFTLVEVMVALIIVAFLLPALLMGFNQQADGIAYLRDKSVAQWVASNKLTETRLGLQRTQQLFKGERSGSTEMAQREWYWWLESEATEIEDFYRIEVRVADSKDGSKAPLFTLVGFLAATAVEGAGGG